MFMMLSEWFKSSWPSIYTYKCFWFHKAFSSDPTSQNHHEAELTNCLIAGTIDATHTEHCQPLPPYHGLHLEEENGFSNLSTHTMISWYLVFLSANPNQYSDNAAKNYCWSSFCGFCQQWFSWASSCLLRLIVWPLPNLWLFRWMGGWMPNRQLDRPTSNGQVKGRLDNYLLTKERFFILN